MENCTTKGKALQEVNEALKIVSYIMEMEELDKLNFFEQVLKYQLFSTGIDTEYRKAIRLDLRKMYMKLYEEA